MAEYYGQVDWSKVGASMGKFASRARKSAKKLGAQAREAAMAMQQKMAARAGASYYGNRTLTDEESGALTGARVHAMANLKRASGGRIHYYDGNGDCKMIAGSMRDDATGMPCSEYYGQGPGPQGLQGAVALAKANLNRASGGRIHYYDGNGDCKMIAGSMRDDATGMPCSEYYGQGPGPQGLQGAVALAKANLNRASGGRIHYYDGNGDCKMIAGSMRDDATGMPCSEYYGNLEGDAYDQCVVRLGKATGPDGSRMPISQRKSICRSQ